MIEKIEKIEKSASASHPPSVVVAEKLVKKYNDFTAVDSIDFDVKKGECLGLLGPNGAGKTTAMRMIVRSASVTSGSLTVFGMDATTGAHDRAIKARIGVVPQEDSLDQEMTLRENLAVFCAFYGLSGRAAQKRIDELLDFVELTEKADVPVSSLSGGMKRRGIIARSLLGSPDLVILDEPTTGLDPQVRQKLWEKMAELKAQGTTLLLTTHYMDEAERLCDRLVVVENGRVVARGTPNSVIQDHLPPFCVEVMLDTGLVQHRENIENLIAAATHAEKLRERLLLFTDDGNGVWQRAVAAFAGQASWVRRTTLEDVFIKLTGRSLDVLDANES